MNYAEHKQKWKNCQLCTLCNTRSKVVLARGVIPCDILCCAEAPGPSEDTIGRPLVGPSGDLFDDILERSGLSKRRFLLCNLVGCYPAGDEGGKLKQPPPDSIKACAPRLRELIAMAKPKRIVAVGALATKWLPKLKLGIEGIPVTSVLHPAFIIRLPAAEKEATFNKTVVILEGMLEEMGYGR